MLGLGFGFVEVGTVTPQPQAGNPQSAAVPACRGRSRHQPHGLQQSRPAAAAERLAAARSVARDRRRQYRRQQGQRRPHRRLCRGREGDELRRRLSDDQHQLAQHARASPAAGRRGASTALLAAVQEARPDGGPPIFLKVAPDLGRGRAGPDRSGRDATTAIDALIVANTTVARPPLKSRHAAEAGGLSGAPLKSLALQALRDFRSASGGRNAADRRGRDRVASTTHGSASAPGRAWSSFTRRWSMRARGSPAYWQTGWPTGSTEPVTPASPRRWAQVRTDDARLPAGDRSLRRPGRCGS